MATPSGRPTRPPRTPCATRPVAWLAVLALVLQAVLVGPLALRMAVGHAGPAGFDAASICTAHPDAVPDAGAPGHGEDRDHAGHARCLICQAAAGSLLLPPDAVAAPLPSARSESVAAVAQSIRATVRPAAYRSRAPPITV
ncbi:DUF2946 family protein [Azospirillum halopraeferens]|uniref:DUF2946 family protein n=1 Tax=Azospirillum halopraeferens TaxID=34010 RepID=UPI0003FDE919|nr:DUF2946 family protein [Azospirillum halopraeferens]